MSSGFIENLVVVGVVSLVSSQIGTMLVVAKLGVTVKMIQQTLSQKERTP